MNSSEKQEIIKVAANLFPMSDPQVVGAIGTMVDSRHDLKIVLAILQRHATQYEFLKLVKLRAEIEAVYPHPKREITSGTPSHERRIESAGIESIARVNSILDSYSDSELEAMKQELIVELSAGGESQQSQAKFIVQSKVATGKIIRSMLADRIQRTAVPA